MSLMTPQESSHVEEIRSTQMYILIQSDQLVVVRQWYNMVHVHHIVHCELIQVFMFVIGVRCMNI